jgi:hypothetical protein
MGIIQDLEKEIEELRNILEVFPDRLKALEAKVEAAFKVIDSNRENREQKFNDLTIWQTKLDIFVAEIKELKLITWVYDVNNFIRSARKLIWGIGIAAITTFVGAIIAIVLDRVLR